MNPVNVLPRPSIHLPEPDTGSEATISPPTSKQSAEQPSSLPPRPDAQPTRPRASSLQLARFSDPDKKALLPRQRSASLPPQRSLNPPELTTRGLQGDWKNATNDIVSHVASHLATPDRLALSQSSIALHEAMKAHKDLNLPQGVIKAWTALKYAPNIKALDMLLGHLPSAGNLDISATVMEFLKHIDHLKEESTPSLEHLDHLYDALSSLNEKSPKVTTQLIKGLFDYGLNQLPPGTHAKGLQKIVSSLYDMALARNELVEITDLKDTAIQKFNIMAQHNLLDANEFTEIRNQLLETNGQIQAGKLHNYYSSMREQPEGVKLLSALVKSTLNTLPTLNNVHAQLDLAQALITHSDRLESKDVPAVTSTLNALLGSLHEQGTPSDKLSSLLTRVNKLNSSEVSHQ
jgi:hypothetical protein